MRLLRIVLGKALSALKYTWILIVAVGLVGYCKLSEMQVVPTWYGLCHIVDKTLDDPVAFFTALLTYVVYLQWLWMSRQERVLQDSVNVAKSAAEAIPKIERAYVFLERVEMGGDSVVVTTSGSRKKKIYAPFSLRNYGKTPAIVKEVFAEVRFCNDFSEATGASGTLFPPGKVIGNTDFNDFPCVAEVDEADYDRAMFHSKPLLLFFGSVRYTDVLNQDRVTAFCRQFDFNSRAFILSDDPDHNYWT